MGKGSGNTRAVNSRNASASRSDLGGGRGVASGNNFSANARISSFEGDTSMNGGYYSLMTKDGKYSMVIETTNGYIPEFGSDGTLIAVGIQKGTGPVESLANDFVEAGSQYRNSGGAVSYGNEGRVADRINGGMPYYAELANKWIKRNK